MSRFQSMIATLVVVVPMTFAFGQEKPANELDIDLAGLPAQVENLEGVTGGAFQDGRLYLAGQPNQDALRHFQELGVTAVVNLRTPEEMDNRDRVPFDEAALVSELGMEYVHIPLGGDEFPYTPDAVARFAAVFEKHKGPVLLHCTVAWRASYLWVAYLILYHDLPMPAALARGEAIAISPPPLQGLLGRPLTLVYDDEPPSVSSQSPVLR